VNLKRKLALSAGAAFGVSFFLPALDKESGFSCLLDCWGVFTRSDSSHALPMGGWLYYSGFVAANALFILLWGAILYPVRLPRMRMCISLVSLLQVLSWFVVSIVHVDKEDHFALRIGYFLWLFSFILLFSAHLFRDHEPKPSTDPAP
jgi:hypothetical protein